VPKIGEKRLLIIVPNPEKELGGKGS